MIIAPLGQLQCKRYADTSLHNYLKLDFKGSILIQTFGTNPSIPEVFASQRDYAYDDSFQSTPPPYLPSISIVYFSAEETVGAIQ